jgi:hypothetical protein
MSTANAGAAAVVRAIQAHRSARQNAAPFPFDAVAPKVAA